MGKDYSALVSNIKTSLTEENTNLAKTILRIICHVEIKKGNMEDTKVNTKVLATRTSQVPKKTCTTQECIEMEVATHFSDRCKVKHSEICAKYFLRHMRMKTLNCNLRKRSALVESELRASPGVSEIDSWQLKVWAIEGLQGNC